MYGTKALEDACGNEEEEEAGKARYDLAHGHVAI